MKDKIIFLFILLVAIILMHSGKHQEVDMSKMTKQEKNMVQFGLASGM